MLGNNKKAVGLITIELTGNPTILFTHDFKDEANLMGESPFLQSIESFMLARRYSKLTVNLYLCWIKFYITFQNTHRLFWCFRLCSAAQ